MSNPISELLPQLRLPFHPAHVEWKPGQVNSEGTRALALAYADLRAYQNRLDELCGGDWSVTYTPWGDRIVCHLTILGVTRSSTGEPDTQSERSEIAGTSAEAQAFKRACSMFGLGRYLYNLPANWVEYDKNTRRFTEKAAARLMGIVHQHYTRTMQEANGTAPDDSPDPANSATPPDGTDPANSATPANGTAAANGAAPASDLYQQFDRLGRELYANEWATVSSYNAQRISDGQITDPQALSPEQIQKLLNGLRSLASKRRQLKPSKTHNGVPA